MFLISCIACLTVQWEPQSMWGGRGSPLRTWNYGGRHFMAPASDGWLTLGMFVFVSLAAGCVHLLCSWRWTCFLAVDTLILHFTTFPPSKIWLGSFISEISLSNVRVLTVWRGLSCLTPASFYRRLPRWRKLYFCLVSIQRITFSVAKPLSENFTNANSWFIPAVILMPMVISCGRYCIIFPVFTVVKWGVEIHIQAIGSFVPHHDVRLLPQSVLTWEHGGNLRLALAQRDLQRCAFQHAGKLPKLLQEPESALLRGII